MKARLLIAAFLAATAVPLHAAAEMSAGEFLRRAEPLMKKSKVPVSLQGTG